MRRFGIHDGDATAGEGLEREGLLSGSVTRLGGEGCGESEAGSWLLGVVGASSSSSSPSLPRTLVAFLPGLFTGESPSDTTRFRSFSATFGGDSVSLMLLEVSFSGFFTLPSFLGWKNDLMLRCMMVSEFSPPSSSSLATSFSRQARAPLC